MKVHITNINLPTTLTVTLALPVSPLIPQTMHMCSPESVDSRQCVETVLVDWPIVKQLPEQSDIQLQNAPLLPPASQVRERGLAARQQGAERLKVDGGVQVVVMDTSRTDELTPLPIYNIEIYIQQFLVLVTCQLHHIIATARTLY